MDLERNGAATRFTSGAAKDAYPVWSPDGSRIVFRSDRDVVENLYWKLASGAKDEELLLKSDGDKYPLSWSRDGRFLWYQVYDLRTLGDLWILPNPSNVPGSGKPMLFQGTAASELSGRFAPDGRWIAYESNENGRREVYVREFALGTDGQPEVTTKRQISTGGGTFPIWSQDGKELLYFAPGRRTVMSVEISTQPVFRATLPKTLFAFPARLTAGPAISADGQRFLAPVPLQENGPDPFTVVLNWNVGLRK